MEVSIRLPRHQARTLGSGLLAASLAVVLAARCDAQPLRARLNAVIASAPVGSGAFSLNSIEVPGLGGLRTAPSECPNGCPGGGELSAYRGKFEAATPFADQDLLEDELILINLTEPPAAVAGFLDEYKQGSALVIRKGLVPAVAWVGMKAWATTNDVVQRFAENSHRGLGTEDGERRAYWTGNKTSQRLTLRVSGTYFIAKIEQCSSDGRWEEMAYVFADRIRDRVKR